MKKYLAISLALIAALALTACGPSEAELQATAAAVQTGAAQTVAVQFTQNALLTPSVTNTPTPSQTPTPTLTPTPGTVTATATKAVSGGGGTGGSGGTAGGGCDAMAFVSDVTVPDGSDYAPNSTFTKTWRVRNSATCTWSTSYSVVFVSGNQMGATSPQPLTASIAPGSTLDISVNMTAPATNGSYTGYWALRNAAGENFGSFYVQINVTSGGSSGGSGSGTCTGTPSGNTTCITVSASSSGTIDQTGGSTAGISAGDNASAQGIRGFFGFSLSSIPGGATITSVTLSGTANTDADPFQNSFGCMSLQSGAFSPFGSNYSSSGTAVTSWCSFADLGGSFSLTNDALKAAVQSAYSGGGQVYFRIHFGSLQTNSDSTANRVNVFGPQLKITYTTP